MVVYSVFVKANIDHNPHHGNMAILTELAERIATAKGSIILSGVVFRRWMLVI
jgi:hypothetical protein